MSHRRDQCMKCPRPPTKAYVWASGKARAWFCERHSRAFEAEHKGDIQKIVRVKGIVSAG